MVSTSGSQLLPEDAVDTLIRELLPLTTILTPNLPEAQLLLRSTGVASNDPQNVDDLVEIAKSIQQLGPKYVLLKGGHLPFTKGHIVAKGDAEQHVIFNVLYGDGRSTLIENKYLKSRNTHGTGCSLACEYFSNMSGWLSDRHSCDRLQSRFRNGYGESSPDSKQIRGSRHQYKQRYWQG